MHFKSEHTERMNTKRKNHQFIYNERGGAHVFVTVNFFVELRPTLIMKFSGQFFFVFSILSRKNEKNVPYRRTKRRYFCRQKWIDHFWGQNRGDFVLNKTSGQNSKSSQEWKYLVTHSTNFQYKDIIMSILSCSIILYACIVDRIRIDEDNFLFSRFARAKHW